MVGASSPASRSRPCGGAARRPLIGLLAGLSFGLANRVGAAPFAYIPTGLVKGAVTIIDTATNTVSATVPFSSPPLGAAVSADGQRVYVTRCLANNLSIIDGATQMLTTSVAVGTCPFAVALDPPGTRAYVSNHFDSTVSVVDTVTGAAIATVGTDALFPTGLVVHPTGARLYVGSEVGPLSVIDTASNTVATTIPVGDVIIGVAINPAGTEVYATDFADGTLSVIDTAHDTLTTTVPVGAGAYGVAVHPDGSRVYVANNGDNTVSVLDAATAAVIATVPVGEGPNGVALDPTGAHLYVANGTSDSVSVIDTATHLVVATVPVAPSPSVLGVFIAPGGGPQRQAPAVQGDGCSSVPPHQIKPAAAVLWMSYAAMLLLRRVRVRR